MTDVENFFSTRPECFGYRDKFELSKCTKCKQIGECFSATVAVITAMLDGLLPADGYETRDLTYIKCIGAAKLRCFGVKENYTFSNQILAILQMRSYPPRLKPHKVSTSVSKEHLVTMKVQQPEKTLSTPTNHVPTNVLSPRTEPCTTAENTTVANSVTTAKSTHPAKPGSRAVVVGAAPVPKVTAGAKPYSFPVPIGRPYAAHTNEQLVSALKKMVALAFSGPSPDGYATIRDNFCAIHIEMNLRQQHAPRFRPTHRLHKELFTDDEITESRDRQVVDLHWIANSALKPRTAPYRYESIYQNSPFDYVTAEHFAQEKWKPEAKAVRLQLTERLQWECAYFQKQSIRKKWFVIEHGYARKGVVTHDGAPQIEQKLEDAIQRKNRHQASRSVPGMINAWKAQRIAKKNTAEITRLVALMTGERPRDKGAVKRSLASLHDLLS